MKETFEHALQNILKWEGGYVDNPDDPGGETKYGISKSAYPDLEISSLTEEQAAEIYRRDYWDVCGCDDLPAGIDLIVFDCAVNQGPDFAVRTLQRAVGSAVDGLVGPKTLLAAKSADFHSALCEYVAQRGKHYGNLSTFEQFGLGWMRRLADMQERAVLLREPEREA